MLPAILLLAFGLRVVRLGAESLWYDETVSAYLAGQRLPDLVAHTARDIHPPGYYLLLHGWSRLAGDSDMALAYSSLFFGVLLAALAYRLGRQGWNRRVGRLAIYPEYLLVFPIRLCRDFRRRYAACKNNQNNACVHLL